MQNSCYIGKGEANTPMTSLVASDVCYAIIS